MSFGFSYTGLIWLIMLFVPNFIWTKNKPKDYEEYVQNENKVLLIFERAGEFIVTPAALIFSDFNYKGWNFCPITGVDDMRWYMLEMAAMMGNTRYEQLIKPVEEEMMDFNALETGDTYQMPVLLISGSCDWICPVGMIEEYIDTITAPGKEICLIDGCGHSPQGQLPEEFCRAVKKFLNK